jgi:hypothetical protein
VKQMKITYEHGYDEHELTGFAYKAAMLFLSYCIETCRPIVHGNLTAPTSHPHHIPTVMDHTPDRSSIETRSTAPTASYPHHIPTVMDHTSECRPVELHPQRRRHRPSPTEDDRDTERHGPTQYPHVRR